MPSLVQINLAAFMAVWIRLQCNRYSLVTTAVAVKQLHVTSY